jgi:hypothetical protein
MPQTATIPDLQVGSYACHVLINGQPVPESFQLISVQVKQAYQHITSAYHFIQAAGWHRSTGAFQNRYGYPCPLPVLLSALRPCWKATEIILFEGVIVKHRYKNSNSGTRLQVTAKTKSINLALTTRTEVFAKQNDRDIINGIVAARGFNLVAGNTGGGFALGPYAVGEKRVDRLGFY